MLQKFMKITSNSEQAENRKNAERQKNLFSKRIGKYTDLHKPVLNKIMTTQELCVKYNFVVPLSSEWTFLYGC